MKSALETLNPTRVRLTVEVPFEELKPSLDAAYKRIASQVQVPGFRRGKVPPRLIDQRFGRAVVLEEAVNDALPRFYGDAVRENDVAIIGQPEVAVTNFADGEQLTFTAEVDVRPEVELPAYDDVVVTVDDVEVTDEDVAEQLQGLRERFGTLRGVDRPARDGDFLSLDLEAKVDEEEVESASGLSYEVGSRALLDGLDEAVRGLSAGESRTFSTLLEGGDHAGEQADVTVSLKSVKERELPELDDDFAQTASEFDTLEELRADVRTRVERLRRLEQGAQARDKALEALLDRVEVPLPESVVQAALQARQDALAHQLEHAGLSREAYLASEDQDEEAYNRELEERTRQAVKAQFVLDAIARKEQIEVGEPDLTEHLLRTAQRAGLPPDELAQQLVSAGQVQGLVAEVVRGKTLALVLERATVTDSSGRPVDLSALREAGSEPAAPDAAGRAAGAETAAETGAPVSSDALAEPAGATSTAEARPET